MTSTNSINLSEQDLAGLGMHRMAYLREAKMDGIQGFAICAADGSVIGFAPNRVKAMAAVMQNDMELVSVQ
jgi:hypothetical protein